jgi:hypothetical protein
MSAREPGQVRKEAALSGSRQAQRVNPGRSYRRRKRPRPLFDGGCTVRYFFSDLMYLVASVAGALSTTTVPWLTPSYFL